MKAVIRHQWNKFIISHLKSGNSIPNTTIMNITYRKDLSNCPDKWTNSKWIVRRLCLSTQQISTYLFLSFHVHQKDLKVSAPLISQSCSDSQMRLLVTLNTPLEPIKYYTISCWHYEFQEWNWTYPNHRQGAELSAKLLHQ